MMLLTLVLEIMSQIQSNFDLCSSGNNTLLALLLQEEVEEGAQTTIYDDFKFLTKEDVTPVPTQCTVHETVGAYTSTK